MHLEDVSFVLQQQRDGLRIVALPKLAREAGLSRVAAGAHDPTTVAGRLADRLVELSGGKGSPRPLAPPATSAPSCGSTSSSMRGRAATIASSRAR